MAAGGASTGCIVQVRAFPARTHHSVTAPCCLAPTRRQPLRAATCCRVCGPPWTRVATKGLMLPPHVGRSVPRLTHACKHARERLEHVNSWLATTPTGPLLVRGGRPAPPWTSEAAAATSRAPGRAQVTSLPSAPRQGVGASVSMSHDKVPLAPAHAPVPNGTGQTQHGRRVPTSPRQRGEHQNIGT